MGRHAVEESLLTAFLRHNTNEELWVQVGQESHGRDFEERFAQLIKGHKVRYPTPVCQSLPQELIKTFHPTLNHAHYMAVLSECDISLLPLRDAPFNRLKSDLKLIESAGCGAVPIFSPMVYAANTHHASVGVMANKATCSVAEPWAGKKREKLP